MKLSAFIKKIRNITGMTQLDLAKKLKMSQATIASWEKGKRALSQSSCRKLKKFCSANAIHFNIGELI